MAHAHGGEYDEDRAGPRDGNNYVSFPKHGVVHKATKKVWPWGPAGNHEQEERVLVPGVFVEALFAHAPVPKPEDMSPVKFLVKCLSLEAYVGEAFTRLIDEGLFVELDDDDNEVDRVYDDPDDLYIKAEELIKQMPDEPALQVNGNAFEWLEGFENRAEDVGLAWFYGLDLQMLTTRTGTLQLYVALSLAVGPRSTMACRIAPDGTFYTMIGTQGGGQIGHAIKSYYYPNDAVVSTAFLLRRLADFFYDSAWPDVYQHHYARWEDYAFDLPNQALWSTATRQQWAALVQNKLARTLIKRHTPTLHALFYDLYGKPHALVREVQALADMVMHGEDAQKLPFYNLERLEMLVEKDFGEYVGAQRDDDEADTETILKAIFARLRVAKAGEKGAGGSSVDQTAETPGPKPGQMARAFGMQGYVEIELKYLPMLQGTMVVAAVLEMLGTCFAARTVLVQAVLFATKGTRMTVYTGQAGTDFLALLYAKRHLLARYIGQSLAYDADLKAVPEALKNFEFDATELQKLTEFEWDKLDFLNGFFLKLMGAEVGTTFAEVTTATLYHRGDMLTYIQEHYGRLFQCIGWPKEVPAEEGWSFSDFIGQLKRIQKIAIALTPDEQRGAHELIDKYKKMGYTGAAEDGKREIYGPCPADQKLGAFVRADSILYSELTDSLKALVETSQWRRRMGAICGKPIVAAAPEGFGPGKRSTPPSEASSSGQPPSKRTRGKKAKNVSFAAGTKTGAPAATGHAAGKKPAQPKSGSPRSNEDNKVGGLVESKMVFPYVDGSFSIGTQPMSSQTNDTARVHTPRPDHEGQPRVRMEGHTRPPSLAHRRMPREVRA